MKIKTFKLLQMKNLKIFFIALLLFKITVSVAQETGKLPIIKVNKDVTTNLVAPGKIINVDFSSMNYDFEINSDRIVSCKPLIDSVNSIVTIITDKYIVQYLLQYDFDISEVTTLYNIPYKDVNSFISDENLMSEEDMYSYANKMLASKNKYYDVSTKKDLMTIRLNNIYTVDNYFFIDVAMFNKSNIKYDIENISFRIEDKKQVKATNFQSIDITPLMEINHDRSFKKNYRNIFCFEKFTFPSEKVFVIEFQEKQVSGRVITLRIEYIDVLKADTFVLK